ncbi:hypothetical protein AB0C47_34205 [Micromonospora taraxaci]
MLAIVGSTLMVYAHEKRGEAAAANVATRSRSTGQLSGRRVR